MWLYWFAKIIFWLPAKIIFPTKFFNKKRIPKGKCIIACNHVSGWDPIILAAYLNRPVCFMAKADFYKNPILKVLLTTLHCVPAKRDGKDFQAIRDAIILLEKGYAFGLFPEGTRNYKDPDHIQEFKNGVALFALKSQTPVMPVIIKRKTRPFRRNFVTMGEPVSFEEYYGGRIGKESIDGASEKLWKEMDKLQDGFNKTLSEKYPKKFIYTQRAIEEKAENDENNG